MAASKNALKVVCLPGSLSELKNKSSVLISNKSQPAEIQIFVDLEKRFRRSNHLWICSSGSSQNLNQSAKLIALSWQAIESSALAVNEHLRTTSKDIWACFLPTYHIGGFSIQVRAALANARYLDFSEDKWNAQEFVNKITHHQVSLTSLVPTQVFDLINAGLQAPDCLRAVIIGGAHLSSELYFAARALNWPLLPSYGMTETSSQVATAEIESLTIKSYPALRILAHTTISQSSDLFLLIRSASLMSGYAQLIDGQARWVEHPIGQSLTTQDKGHISGQFLSQIHRDGDVIKVAGVGVNLLKETEFWRNELKPISDLAVWYQEDPRKGYQLILFMALSEKTNWEKWIGFISQVNQRLVPSVRIKKVIRLKSIPRSDLGKLLPLRLPEQEVITVVVL